MRQLVIIFISIIIACIFAYLLLFRKFKKNTNKPRRDRQRQNKLNTQHVLDIIGGDISNPSDIVLSNYEAMFNKWQETQFDLVNNAKQSDKDIFFSLEPYLNIYVFRGNYSQETPGKEYTLFMDNCFTEPFHSGHDMDDWARHQFIWQILLLNGINEEGSKDLYFFEKAHFVNHKKLKAIILVDVYKKS